MTFLWPRSVRTRFPDRFYFELKPISGPIFICHIFAGLLFGILDATDLIIPAWLFKLPIMTEIERILVSNNFSMVISTFMTTQLREFLLRTSDA